MARLVMLVLLLAASALLITAGSLVFAKSSSSDDSKDSGSGSSDSGSSSSDKKDSSSSDTGSTFSTSTPSVPDKDCAFTPTLDKCKPDAAGNCPSGFSKNVNNDCIPNKCPKGFVKQDKDETGKCFAKKIKGR